MKVTVAEHQILGYQGSRVPTSARLYASADFTNEDGLSVPGGKVGSSDFYREVAASLSGETITIAPFELNGTDNRVDSTVNDSVHNGVGYSLAIFDANGKHIYTPFTDLKVPDLVTPTTWALVDEYSQSRRFHYSVTQATWERVLALYNTLTSAAVKATSVITGIARLSKTPVNLADPIAVGDNDTRLAWNLANFGGTFAGAKLAIAALGDPDVLLTVSESVIPPAGTTTLPANITLDFATTGYIDLRSGRSLSIGSMRDPGNRKVFLTEDETAAVTFERGAVDTVKTAWWSGLTGGDLTAHLKAAVASVSAAGGVVILPDGDWESSDEVVIPSGVFVEGAFKNHVAGKGTTITMTAANPLFRVNGGTANIGFRNLKIDGGSIAGTTGILLEGVVADGNVSNVRVENVAFTNIDYGFRVKANDVGGGVWQTVQLYIDSTSIFINCMTAAVRCNTVNSSMVCDANIFPGNGGRGFWVEGFGVLTCRGADYGYPGIAGYGTSQFMQQTVVAPAGITTDGDGRSVVTGFGLPNSPVTVTVPLTIAEHTTEPLIAAAYRKALANDPSVASYYYIGGTGADIQLIRIDPEADDPTMNFTVEDVTSAGITDDILATQVAAGAPHTAIGESILYIDGTYSSITFIGCQDEGVASGVIHNSPNPTGQISYFGCLLQSPIRMEEAGQISIYGGTCVSKLVRDSVAGSGSVVVADTNVADQIFASGQFRTVEQRLTNFGASAASSVSIQTVNKGAQMATAHASSGLPGRRFQNDTFASYPTTEPWYSITSTRPDQRLLFLGAGNALGVPTHGYLFWRETATGFLHIDGTQGAAFRAVQLNCPLIVPASAYNATTWNGDFSAATRDDVRDIVETILAAIAAIIDGQVFTGAIAAPSIAVGSGTAITKIVRGTVAVNPASVAADTVATQTFTLTGAVVGDSLTLNPPAAGLTAGLLVLQAWVSAADTISIVFFNHTASPIDEGSANWTYLLVRS